MIHEDCSKVFFLKSQHFSALDNEKGIKTENWQCWFEFFPI